MVWHFIGVYIINRTLLHSLVKYFSTLEEKFRISTRPCIFPQAKLPPKMFIIKLLPRGSAYPPNVGFFLNAYYLPIAEAVDNADFHP